MDAANHGSDGEDQRKMVDIFSHFGRLISSRRNDKYLQKFEQNNLLANTPSEPYGYNCQRINPFVTNNITSLPPAGSQRSEQNDLDTPIIENKVTDEKDRLNTLTAKVSLSCLNQTNCAIESALPGELTLKGEDKKNVSIPKAKSGPARPPMLPPCRVCGDAASGFHYGVNTCEACKGFFRRSITKAVPYVCVSSGNCKTILGRRTVCSACRFKRCLEVGMSKHAIKTGRYTHELRSRNILEVKRLQKQKCEEKMETEDPKSEVLIAGPSYSTFGRTEESAMKIVDVKPEIKGEYTSELNSLLEGQSYLYEFLDDYYDKDLMLQRQIAVYERYLEDKKKREILERAYRSRYNLMNDQHPGNKQTNSETGGKNDCTLNHKDNSPFTKGAQDSTGSNVTVCSSSQTQGPSGEQSPGLPMEDLRDPTEDLKANVLAMIMKDMKRGVKGILAFAKKIPGFVDLHNEDQAALLHAARVDIWFLGHIRCFNTELQVGACEWKFHADELSKVWGDELVEKTFNLSKIGQEMDLSKEETAALRGFCVSCTDRCYPLQDRAAVEMINERMFNVLKETVQKRHRNFNMWFAKAIRLMVNLREVSMLYVEISSNVKLEWSVLKDNPTLLEVFLS